MAEEFRYFLKYKCGEYNITSGKSALHWKTVSLRIPYFERILNCYRSSPEETDTAFSPFHLAGVNKLFLSQSIQVFTQVEPVGLKSVCEVFFEHMVISASVLLKNHWLQKVSELPALFGTKDPTVSALLSSKMWFTSWWEGGRQTDTASLGLTLNAAHRKSHHFHCLKKPSIGKNTQKWVVFQK